MPGKMARSDPRPAFGLPEVMVAVSTSRLSCKRAGKTRTLMPAGDSSGESRLLMVVALVAQASIESTKLETVPRQVPRNKHSGRRNS
jgi:hypothetical protein